MASAKGMTPRESDNLAIRKSHTFAKYFAKMLRALLGIWEATIGRTAAAI
jgi:hypothetical protein